MRICHFCSRSTEALDSETTSLAKFFLYDDRNLIAFLLVSFFLSFFFIMICKGKSNDKNMEMNDTKSFKSNAVIFLRNMYGIIIVIYHKYRIRIDYNRV